jgi:hypothetical protein
MLQLLQLVGAMMVLAGFAMVQFGVVRATATGYLALNLAGSAILAVLALRERQWGFLLLEGVWALVSAHGLLAAARSHRARRPPRGPRQRASNSASARSMNRTSSSARPPPA